MASCFTRSFINWDEMWIFRGSLKLKLDKSPSFKAAYEGMGICHTELGERDQAIVCFNRYLELDPGDN